MQSKIHASFSCEEMLFGSSQYSLIVNVTNTHDADLSNFDVEPLVVPGVLLSGGVEVKDSAQDFLEAKWRSLTKEMEIQIARAFEKHSIRQMKPRERLWTSLSSILDLYLSSLLFIPVRAMRVTPMWAREALRVITWADVERLEAEIMSMEPEESFLRKAFNINKEKLRRIEEAISEQRKRDPSLKPGLIIAPGETITFPFTIRAPHLFRPRNLDAQVRVSFTDPGTNTVGSSTFSYRTSFYASPFAVPLGGVLGAIAGYLIRLAPFATPSVQQFDWFTLLASVLLGLLAAAVTARSQESNKVVTVEDLLGGFIIGAVAGLFSEQILARIGQLIT